MNELRELLGRRLGVPAAAIQLSCNQEGMPFLSRPTGTGLNFSVSHSGGLILYALSSTGRIGVDVQVERVGVDWRGLAARFFPPEEADRVQAEGPATFYRLWTRKEALKKAYGGSLFTWLRTDVSSPPKNCSLWTWRAEGAAASIALRRC
jgi:4'-phosphopantetheinyl transferase